jgi:hypothetical protein
MAPLAAVRGENIRCALALPMFGISAFAWWGIALVLAAIHSASRRVLIAKKRLAMVAWQRAFRADGENRTGDIIGSEGCMAGETSSALISAPSIAARQRRAASNSALGVVASSVNGIWQLHALLLNKEAVALLWQTEYRGAWTGMAAVDKKKNNLAYRLCRRKTCADGRLRAMALPPHRCELCSLPHRNATFLPRHLS